MLIKFRECCVCSPPTIPVAGAWLTGYKNKEEEGKMIKFNSRLGFFAGMAAASLLGGVANGQTWTESGDAPDLLPGQETSGSGALTQIDGNHDANDADLYKITISDAGTFSATTVGGTSLDTQLFLFDSNGMGISHNDDDPQGGGLQSRITGVFVPGPGVYYLAVSTWNMDPNSTGGLIFQSTPFNIEHPADGPGAGSPLLNWTPGGTTAGTYSIFLTGAGFGNAGGYFLSVGGTCPGTATVAWSGATPNKQQAIVFAATAGNFVIPNGPCQGTMLGLSSQGLRLVNTIGTGSGSGQVSGPAGTAACGGKLQLVELPSCNTSNVGTIP